jgi:hypothetical protein
MEAIVAMISAVFCSGALCFGGLGQIIHSGTINLKPEDLIRSKNEQEMEMGSSHPGATTGIVNYQKQVDLFNQKYYSKECGPQA